MDLSPRLHRLLTSAIKAAGRMKHEYVVPEHLLYVLCDDREFRQCCDSAHCDPDRLKGDVKRYLKIHMPAVADEDSEIDYKPELSRGFRSMIEMGALQAQAGGRNQVDLTHVFYAMMKLPQSYPVYLVSRQGADITDIFFALSEMEPVDGVSEDDESGDSGSIEGINLDPEALARFTENPSNARWLNQLARDNRRDRQEQARRRNEGRRGDDSDSRGGSHSHREEKKLHVAVCLNDLVRVKNDPPLVGRENELRETELVLERMEKNNPLHVGEPGVGKTAIIRGLARLINSGDVPDSLQGAQIYQIDMGTMVAGTQFRGEFEKRMKTVLDSIERLENPIVYIDEIHTVVGTGAGESSTMDGANILKPYLLRGHIRFIGSTTYDEYKNTIEKDKALARRFQKIDIPEPTPEETVKILEGIQSYYEDFHQVVYDRDVIRYIVDMSVKYINEKYLPDKAIDVMDTAGAMLNYERFEAGSKAAAQADDSGEPADTDISAADERRFHVVTKDTVNRVLSTMLRIPLSEVDADETEKLRTLEDQLKASVFGQDQAVEKICKAIRMSRAGLNEENKPVASMLFVGPTGVGKTEIARTLSRVMNMELVRFDMSEYMDRYSVDKFIGAPAGYVGHEEGGLLVEAIRKNPCCVLLLDEIEKAHPDVLNVLLQVMDYATLTDSKGRKADFRNVIIIMTSNAGAADASRPAMGFGGGEENTGAVDDAVRSAFSPEFRNRLTCVVQFNHLDSAMGELVVDKQIRLLNDHLKARNVNLTVSPALKAHILKEGISREYGARQIQRVIDSEIKPVLVDELLFGSLKDGGEAQLDYEDGQVLLRESELA